MRKSFQHILPLCSDVNYAPSSRRIVLDVHNLIAARKASDLQALPRLCVEATRRTSWLGHASITTSGKWSICIRCLFPKVICIGYRRTIPRTFINYRRQIMLQDRVNESTWKLAAKISRDRSGIPLLQRASMECASFPTRPHQSRPSAFHNVSESPSFELSQNARPRSSTRMEKFRRALFHYGGHFSEQLPGLLSTLVIEIKELLKRDTTWKVQIMNSMSG